MSRLFSAVAARSLIVASIGCSAQPATREREPINANRPVAVTDQRPAVEATQTPADQGVARTLTSAIENDVELRERDIRFVVSNGDVSVKGTVRTEASARESTTSR